MLFTSFRNVFDGDVQAALRSECETLFSATSKSRGAYSEGQTFWVSADATPRSLVEAFALNVFVWHTSGCAFDRSQAGVEFWSLVMDRKSDVGAHFDKDYGAEDQGRHLYPNVGTVTYLDGGGAAPTLFFDCREEELPKRVGKAYVSKVEAGKHVAFDGRLLHAASSLLGSRASGDGRQKRVTLLVNVWLTHKPVDAVEYAAPGPCAWQQMKLPPPEGLPIQRVALVERSTIEMRLDKKRVVRFCPPSLELLWKETSSSLVLEFEEGACVFEKSKTKNKKKTKDKKGKKGKKEKGKKGK